ncbi:MAG: bifunctional pyr operon transcriptional regulator/uracil phosphoribosyltransferase [Candidatus Muproteobacteria bacterium RIFCSPHIGHO2_01_FULL_65_16]|uniref:Bifunctional pyr operon transcriptional regulator/uracil phosphoribosyltransferase n=1 Tax=Candidatus Muproteobacteria bacterium RIFCSPHIGHO2_01_FULL_65_16 TaxID=1817764 RepID=A0A1F6THX7_9PROT|nr:MAG: bifunctional pyr operon transcriptional regulator/uracil phosphoribosyltransferase [Candidatus Muproteobacteria bacterium RIFCSPHIGHO2_01_FULL_65_16]
MVDIEAALAHMAEELRPLLKRDPVMIGIHTGGVWVAQRLHRLLGLKEPLGTLDISFYRDDFTRIGMNPEVKASNLPVNIEGRHVILVDDVLHTGRTIRAAMNEIFDYGRPAAVTLAVLIERDGRELPIAAQVVGGHVRLDRNQHIKLGGPERLTLKIQEAGA